MMTELRSVFIGNLAVPAKGEVYGLKNYAHFYNELAAGSNGCAIRLFAGYVLPGETGYDFANEVKLDEQIDFRLSKGNTPSTGLIPFLFNNVFLLARLVNFSLKSSHYFIFLPSPLGALSAWIVGLIDRKKTLGIYIGGYYGKEQAFEKRKGGVKKVVKRIAARMVDRLVHSAIRQADYVITSSYEYYDQYASTGKIHLVPPMINVDESDLQEQYELPSENYITYCGELRHAKGVVELVKAFALVCRNNPGEDLYLKLIGSGQAEEELKTLAKNLDISLNIIFCGQIKDKELLKKELAASKLFVLPSYSEGFPRVAYECFTLGIPTVLTPVGGIPYLVKDGVHCLFAEPGDVEGLAGKMQLLLKDEELHQRLSANARQLMIDSIFPRIRIDKSLAAMIIKHTRQLKAV